MNACVRLVDGRRLRFVRKRHDGMEGVPVDCTLRSGEHVQIAGSMGHAAYTLDFAVAKCGKHYRLRMLP